MGYRQDSRPARPTASPATTVPDGHDVGSLKGWRTPGRAPRAAHRPVARPIVIALAVDHQMRRRGRRVCCTFTRACLGNDDGHRDAETRGVVGQGPVWLPRGAMDAGFFSASLSCRACSARALLVGRGELQVLDLHPDIGAGDLRQGGATAAGRRSYDLQPGPWRAASSRPRSFGRRGSWERRGSFGKARNLTAVGPPEGNAPLVQVRRARITNHTKRPRTGRGSEAAGPVLIPRRKNPGLAAL